MNTIVVGALSAEVKTEPETEPLPNYLNSISVYYGGNVVSSTLVNAGINTETYAGGAYHGTELQKLCILRQDNS